MYTKLMIRLPCACRGRTAVRFPANISHICCVELALTGLALAGKGYFLHEFSLVTDRRLCHMLMSPSQSETAVHGCHCPREMAVRMREVIGSPWVGVCVPLVLIYWYLVIHLPRTCRARTAVQFPANSSHMCCVELALNRLLCTHLGSKGFQKRGFLLFINSTALPRLWAPITAKQLSVGATARVIWLCASVRH